MHERWKALGGFLILAMCAAGCAKGGGLHFEKKASIPGAQNLPAQIIEKFNRDRQVQINVSSGEGPISVYVVLEKDTEALLDQLPTKKIRVSVVDKKENTKEASLSVKIPAGTEYAVVVTNESAKTANVTVKFDSE